MLGTQAGCLTGRLKVINESPLPTILPVQKYLLTKVPSAGVQNKVGLDNSPHILTFDIFMHDSGALFERLFD